LFTLSVSPHVYVQSGLLSPRSIRLAPSSSAVTHFQTEWPRVMHSRWHYLNSLPPQDYAMATKLGSADWRWEKRKL